MTAFDDGIRSIAKRLTLVSYFALLEAVNPLLEAIPPPRVSFSSSGQTPVTHHSARGLIPKVGRQRANHGGRLLGLGDDLRPPLPIPSGARIVGDGEDYGHFGSLPASMLALTVARTNPNWTAHGDVGGPGNRVGGDENLSRSASCIRGLGGESTVMTPLIRRILTHVEEWLSRSRRVSLVLFIN